VDSVASMIEPTAFAARSPLSGETITVPARPSPLSFR
jgi:hypothetical protein